MRRKVLGLFLLSLIIIALLSGILLYNNMPYNITVGKYTIDVNKTLQVDANNSRFTTVEWDKDYMEVLTSPMFNIVNKDKSYNVAYEDNKLVLSKTEVKKIIYYNMEPWITLYQFPQYLTNDSELIEHRVDFILCYPKGTTLDFKGSKVDINSKYSVTITNNK